MKDYIDAFKKKFGIWMYESSVRRYIKKGLIDHVYHEGRYYIVIEDKSMDGLPIPKKYRILKKTSKDKRRTWVVNK